jgi:hypothetical protein
MMTTTAPTKQPNLASIVHESEQAAKAAAAAVAAANAAQARAEEAQRRADAEREHANVAYLDVLEAEHLDARNAALTAQGEARAELERAVRDGANVFTAYSAWVTAGVAVWATDAALSQQRGYLGRYTREATPPVFNFAVDIAAIIDQHTAELQDEALERIRERRAAFLSGREAQ